MSTAIIQNATFRGIFCVIMCFSGQVVFAQNLPDSIIKYYSRGSYRYAIKEDPVLDSSSLNTYGVVNASQNSPGGDRIWKYEVVHGADSTTFIKNGNFFGINKTSPSKRFDPILNAADLLNGSFPFFMIFTGDARTDSVLSDHTYELSFQKDLSIWKLVLQNKAARKVSSNLGEATLIKHMIKYDISSVDYRILRSNNLLIASIDGLQIEDSTKFSYTYLSASQAEIQKEISQFRPYQKEVVKATPQNHISYIPSFFVSDTTNKLFTSTELKSRLVLLDFWYMGCGPCLLNMPNIQKIRGLYNESELAILAVNPFDLPTESIKKRMSAWPYTFPFFFNAGKISKKLNVNQFPTCILYDNQTKKIISRNIGFSSESVKELTDIIDNYNPKKNRK